MQSSEEKVSNALDATRSLIEEFMPQIVASGVLRGRFNALGDSCGLLPALEKLGSQEANKELKRRSNEIRSTLPKRPRGGYSRLVSKARVNLSGLDFRKK